MPAVQGAPRFDVIARQWHALAERRLAYFTELYRSGRWKHYYTREHFASRMLDVIKATKVWGDLAGQACGEPPCGEQPAERNDDLRSAA
jgi:uncharacterized repeat protein (TIGR03809 family)